MRTCEKCLLFTHCRYDLTRTGQPCEHFKTLIDEIHCNSVDDLILALKSNFPLPLCKTPVGFFIQHNPNIHIVISKPDNFSNYSDIIARLTILHNKTICMDTLVSCTTDFKKLFDKVFQKIQIISLV